MSGLLPVPPPPFNWSLWSARFAELAYVGETTAAAFYGEAALMVPAIPLKYPDVNQQALLLDLLAAHLVKLNAPGANGQPAPDLVGRVTNASKGSVSVATLMPESLSAAWFQTTRYGAQFWQATVRLRMARYVPGPVPYLGVGPRIMPGWPGQQY